jgi:poly(3-hydroxybutyrate) depolymerase
LVTFQEGAEICSWIIAISVECKNGLSEAEHITHTQHCTDHLLATQPIDKNRMYFTGNSGGSRVAFINSVRFKGAGVIATIAGAQPGEISRKMDYFFINGATDYNRYGSALSFKEAKSSAAMRFHPGSHSDGPDWLQTEGMVWLESRWHL